MVVITQLCEFTKFYWTITQNDENGKHTMNILLKFRDNLMICALSQLGFLKRLYLKERFVSHESWRQELGVSETYLMNISERQVSHK